MALILPPLCFLYYQSELAPKSPQIADSMGHCGTDLSPNHPVGFRRNDWPALGRAQELTVKVGLRITDLTVWA